MIDDPHLGLLRVVVLFLLLSEELAESPEPISPLDVHAAAVASPEEKSTIVVVFEVEVGKAVGGVVFGFRGVDFGLGGVVVFDEEGDSADAADVDGAGVAVGGDLGARAGGEPLFAAVGADELDQTVLKAVGTDSDR